MTLLDIIFAPLEWSVKLTDWIGDHTASKGYRIRKDTRDSVRYYSKGHVLFIDTPLNTGAPDWTIYASSHWKWEEPHSEEVIDSEQKQLIVSRVVKFFQKRGETYELR